MQDASHPRLDNDQPMTQPIGIDHGHAPSSSPTMIVRSEPCSIRRWPVPATSESHRQRGDAVALGFSGRGGCGHHRRHHARRERLRPHPAHQEGAAGTADHRHERAEYADDGSFGGGEGRLRIPAEAVRSQRAGERRRAGAGGAGAPGRAQRAESEPDDLPLIGGRPRCRRSTA